MDAELLKIFLNLGGMGILGGIFYFTSKASDKRLDKMLVDNATERDKMSQDASKERELWRQTINALNTNLHENTSTVGQVDCLIPRRRK